jgi:hypothetical protein
MNYNMWIRETLYTLSEEGGGSIALDQSPLSQVLSCRLRRAEAPEVCMEWWGRGSLAAFIKQGKDVHSNPMQKP